MGDKARRCNCSRRRQKANTIRRKDRCTRMRQTLVCNEEDVYYNEPYMQHLREEFTPPVSNNCSSSIELPWRDIAISPGDLVKNQEVIEEKGDETEEGEQGEVEDQEPPEEIKEVAPVRKVSSGIMCIPWDDIKITGTIQSELAKRNRNIDKCDSWMEIPWDDILFDPNVKIDESNGSHQCDKDNVEIPWNDLLIPENIVLFPRRRPYHKKSPKTKNKKCGCSRS